jgi:very-short-patch-repair endonuclease
MPNGCHDSPLESGSRTRREPIGPRCRPRPVRADERQARLRELLRTHDGVLSVEQAEEVGYTSAAITAKVRRGEWVRVAYRVLRAADHPDTPRARIRAAMLSVGPDATLVGRSALHWWRLVDTAPADVEIAVTQERQPRPRAGVRLLRRAVPPEDRVVVDGVAVTKKAPTVLAAVAALGTTAGARLMDQVLQQGTVELEALRRAHRRSTGRHGATRCAELLRLAAGGARSQAERLAHRALTAAAITGWCADRPVWLTGYGQALLDLAFDEPRVLVEIDGWAYHRDLRAFLRDADRQNALVLEGWVVIRTNWYELTENPERFVAHVRDALADRRRPPGVGRP